ncbi:hypothetical protein M0Q97_04340 [Candidatus Dojkabacteria bacterium]|jgi:hypothetical protein|nr:hypothetical protein [Candidatus Dojkabacteria bacterium]
MKTLNNWEKFNELIKSTYMNAAKKADEIGHEKLGKKFRDHADVMQKRAVEEENRKNQEDWGKLIEEYSNIEPFYMMTDGTFRTPAYFVGFAWDASIDNSWKAVKVYIKEPEEIDNILVNAMFVLKRNELDFIHVFLNKNGEKYVFDCVDSEGEYVDVKFATRKDANRLLKLLKDRYEFDRLKSFYEPDSIEEYEELLDEFHFPVRLLY